MTQYYFDEPINRYGTDSLKWDAYKGKDIIPLWVADMDFKAPLPVLEALHRRVDHGIFGYTHVPDQLEKVVIQRLLNYYNWEILPDWLVWLPGLVSGLNLCCRATGADGDSVITTVPIYPPFLTAPVLSRRKLVSVGLVDNGQQWIIDFDRLEESITPRTKLFLLCNPHNPTGRVFTRDELEKIASLCLQHDIVICSDEIHCDLILDEGKSHIPTGTISPEIADRTITLMAPSKTYNLPGLGCSFAIIPNKELRRNFKKTMSGIVPEINTLGFTAALSAYRDCGEWHLALLNYLRKGRDLVESSIEKMDDISMRHVEATYLGWLDCLEIDVDDPGTFFQNAGIGLFDGIYFGTPGFLRFNFGCPHGLLQQALMRIEEALNNR